MKKKTILLSTIILIIVLIGVLNLVWLNEPITTINDDISSASTLHGVPNLRASPSKNVNIVDVGLHQDRLFPAYINVNKGDYVILNFASGNITDFSLDGYDNLDQAIKTGNIEFVADKAGVFEYYCLSCPQKSPGLLVVN